MIKTDNVATSSFLTQKRAQPQAGTVARLSGGVRHGPRVQAREDQSNQVADALSRKAELASNKLEEIADMSQLKGARTHKRGVGKGPRCPDPAEKREKLQLEVPLE